MCVKLTNAGGFEQHRPAVQSGGQKSPSGAFLDARLATSTRAHQKSFNVTTALELFVLCVRETHECGWIRTASARRTVRRAKSPSGAFLDARFAISTLAHQEIQYPNRVLDFLFCGIFFRAGREEGKCENQSPVLAQARWVC